MHSTRLPSTIFCRISPSPDWSDDMDPFASTNSASQVRMILLYPGVVCDAGWRRSVLPARVILRFSPPQSLMLNRGLARMKSALRCLCRVVADRVGVVT